MKISQLHLFTSQWKHFGKQTNQQLPHPLGPGSAIIALQATKTIIIALQVTRKSAYRYIFSNNLFICLGCAGIIACRGKATRNYFNCNQPDYGLLQSFPYGQGLIPMIYLLLGAVEIICEAGDTVAQLSHYFKGVHWTGHFGFSTREMIERDIIYLLLTKLKKNQHFLEILHFELHSDIFCNTSTVFAHICIRRRPH